MVVVIECGGLIVTYCKYKNCCMNSFVDFSNVTYSSFRSRYHCVRCSSSNNSPIRGSHGNGKIPTACINAIKVQWIDRAIQGQQIVISLHR